MKRTKLCKVIVMMIAAIMVFGLAACATPDTASDASAPSEDVAVDAESSSDAAESDADASADVSEDVEEITIRIGSAWSADAFTWTQAVVKYFMPKVDEILATDGNYKIKWVEAWGGTVTKVNECLQTVQNGLLDVGWVGCCTQASQLPLNNSCYYVPFAAYDIDQAQIAMESMLEKFPELKDELGQYNQKWLGSVLMDSYQIATNFEFNSMSDLEGKKIGAAGTNIGWFDNTGCVGVQSPGTEAYSSIQTGVIDGTVQSGLMMQMLKLYEPAEYVTLGNFGATWAGFLTVNSDIYEGLPEEVQNAFVEAGVYYMQNNAELLKEKLATFKEDIEANGGIVTEMSEDQRVEWASMLENIPMNYYKQLNDNGQNGEIVIEYMHALEDAGYTLPRKWYDE